MQAISRVRSWCSSMRRLTFTHKDTSFCSCLLVSVISIMRALHVRGEHMAIQEQVEILQQGADAWNTWRAQHTDVVVDLSGADFSKANFGDINLSKANFGGIDLGEANLGGLNFFGEVAFGGANLRRANFRG